MAERGDIDAIILCLPWQTQVDWLDWALAAPKPVLIEKPVALCAASLNAALKRHRDNIGDKLVGYNRRFYATVARLSERLERGGLRSADITISEETTRLVDRHGPEILPYAMENSSCHLLDLSLHLLGPLTVRHMSRYNGYHDGVAFNSYNGLLETPTAVPVAFFNNANDPSRVGIRCRFDDGTAWCLWPSEILTVYRGYDVIERSAACQVRRYTPHKDVQIVEDTSYRPGFVAQMRAFLSATPGPGCNMHEALAVLKLIAQIKRHARDIR